jgi:hypothetical protein
VAGEVVSRSLEQGRRAQGERQRRGGGSNREQRGESESCGCAVGVIRVRDWVGGTAAGFYTAAGRDRRAGQLGRWAKIAVGGWVVPPPCHSP